MPPPSPRNILISLGEHESFHDGLGEFSRQLCTRLAAQAEGLEREHGIRLWFHLKEHLLGSFGSQVNYVVATRAQRRKHAHAERFALWHSLHQLNRTLPPEHTDHRLVTVHDLNFLYFKNWFSRWRDMRRIRALMARTDEIVTITHYVEQDVRQHLGWRRPIQTIHNGVTDLSGAPQEPVALPQIAGLRSSNDALQGGGSAGGYLFHISRLTTSKNIAAILELAAAWPEQAILLAGPASRHSRAVQTAIDQRGLRNVGLLTSVSDAQKAWLFAQCQGLLFPSLAEGFGLPVIEAMHFGKPVFLSRLTALPEVGGTVAHYFDRFEGSAMRKVVQQGLALHHAQHQEDAIRQWAAQFNWDRCAQRYLDLYVQRVAG